MCQSEIKSRVCPIYSTYNTKWRNTHYNMQCQVTEWTSVEDTESYTRTPIYTDKVKILYRISIVSCSI